MVLIKVGVYLKRSTKSYNLGNGYGIECVTIENQYTGERYFNVNVILLAVPWLEVVNRVTRIYDPTVANRVFKEFKERYGSL